MMQHPFHSPSVQAAYHAFDPAPRAILLTLRALIYDTAKTLPVGRVEETLKWGQPSYATPDTRAATPIRLGVTKSGDVGIFTHCQSTVMSDFRALAPPKMRFDGNRALLLPPSEPIVINDITPLIRAALSYRL